MLKADTEGHLSILLEEVKDNDTERLLRAKENLSQFMERVINRFVYLTIILELQEIDGEKGEEIAFTLPDAIKEEEDVKELEKALEELSNDFKSVLQFIKDVIRDLNVVH